VIRRAILAVADLPYRAVATHPRLLASLYFIVPCLCDWSFLA